MNLSTLEAKLLYYNLPFLISEFADEEQVKYMVSKNLLSEVKDSFRDYGGGTKYRALKEDYDTIHSTLSYVFGSDDGELRYNEDHLALMITVYNIITDKTQDVSDEQMKLWNGIACRIYEQHWRGCLSSMSISPLLLKHGQEKYKELHPDSTNHKEINNE